LQRETTNGEEGRRTVGVNTRGAGELIRVLLPMLRHSWGEGGRQIIFQTYEERGRSCALLVKKSYLRVKGREERGFL